MTKFGIGAGLAMAVFLTGCSVRGVENAVTDLVFAGSSVPDEARALQDLPLGDMILAPNGYRQFELGRRFELGVGGVSQDLQCAAHYYEVSGQTTARTRRRATYGWEDVTFLGLPEGRAARRRLANISPPDSPGRCMEPVIEAANQAGYE